MSTVLLLLVLIVFSIGAGVLLYGAVHEEAREGDPVDRETAEREVRERVADRRTGQAGRDRVRVREEHTGDEQR